MQNPDAPRTKMGTNLPRVYLHHAQLCHASEWMRDELLFPRVSAHLQRRGKSPTTVISEEGADGVVLVK